MKKKVMILLFPFIGFVSATAQNQYCLEEIGQLTKNMYNAPEGAYAYCIANQVSFWKGVAGSDSIHLFIGTYPDAAPAPWDAVPVYTDRTEEQIPVSVGDSIFPIIGRYSGGRFTGVDLYWFIDYDKDGEFSREELLSFTYLDETDDDVDNGTNSAGKATTQGRTFDQIKGVFGQTGVLKCQMPSFFIPSGLSDGEYRMRFVTQANSANPCGSRRIVEDYGSIIDYTLKVTGNTNNIPSLNVGRIPAGSIVKLYNLQGILLETHIATEGETGFPAGSYRPGIYVLKVTFEGRELFKQKIIQCPPA
jgi:hypothetical protein